ncbi:hypothetical protein OBBRIDRAFT_834162 [Obba rivulosa]|uniref:BTB domain-containing protein n=1 Tax=Obba rivulosa TaxID=1052685 RepID=A0A8E2B0B6_9APHY|nr:hypothetical protein OBBRIDRAFT_834162 [Obba rivulosa]
MPQLRRLLEVCIVVAPLIVPYNPAITMPVLNHPDLTLSSLIVPAEGDASIINDIERQWVDSHPGGRLDASVELNNFNSMLQDEQDPVRMHRRFACRRRLHPLIRSADAILCSCDDVDFRVHRIIVSEASPLFSATFSLPQPSISSPESSGLPDIPMAETATTLDAVLRFCYPMPNPDSATIDALIPVLEAARKYSIEITVERGRWPLRSRFLDEDPFAVFGVAYHMQVKDEAVLAAHESLKRNVPDASKLGMIPGATSGTLMHWRARCVVAAINFMHDRIEPRNCRDGEWYMSDPVYWELCTIYKDCGYHPPGYYDDQFDLRQHDFVERAIATLDKRPCGTTLIGCENVAFNILPAHIKCMRCRKKAVR